MWKEKKKRANEKFIKHAGINKEDTQKRVVKKVVKYLKHPNKFQSGFIRQKSNKKNH